MMTRDLTSVVIGFLIVLAISSSGCIQQTQDIIPETTGIPEITTPIILVQTKQVAVSARVVNSTLIAIIQGGSDYSSLVSLTINATAPSGKTTTSTVSHPQLGDEMAMASPSIGKIHFVITGRFTDGAQHRILDTYIPIPDPNTPLTKTIENPPVDHANISITCTVESIQPLGDTCIWIIAGDISNTGTARLDNVILEVTMTAATSSYPTIIKQQQIGTLNPGSKRQYKLTPIIQCDSDYHAWISYSGIDDVGRRYSGISNI